MCSYTFRKPSILYLQSGRNNTKLGQVWTKCSGTTVRTGNLNKMEKAIALLALWINLALASKFYYKEEVDTDNAWSPYYLEDYVGFKYDENKLLLIIFVYSSLTVNAKFSPRASRSMSLKVVVVLVVLVVVGTHSKNLKFELIVT